MSSDTAMIEIIHNHIERGHVRHALFDFDGTVSLIREGWQPVMTSMMADLLLQPPRARKRSRAAPR
jgi:phosphoglycolate phosphatase